MSAEALTMRLLAERTRLPVPELIVYDASCRWLPVPYLVMELIPGVPLHTVRRKIAPDARAAIDAQVAAYLRDVHTIAGEAFGTLARPRSGGWPEVFLPWSTTSSPTARSVTSPCRARTTRSAL